MGIACIKCAFLNFILTAKRLHCTNTSLIVYSVVLPCNHQSTKKLNLNVLTPNARSSSEDWWSGFWNWSNQLPFGIVIHCALIHSVSLQYIKMTKLQSHSVSIGEFSVHDIPNFETPLVRGFVPYLDSVTSKRLKDFVMCLEYENELALSGAILNFPRTLLYSCDPLFRLCSVVLIGLFSCAPAWPGAPSSPWPQILSSSSFFLFLEHVSADGSTFPWWPLSFCLLCWFKW